MNNLYLIDIKYLLVYSAKTIMNNLYDYLRLNRRKVCAVQTIKSIDLYFYTHTARAHIPNAKYFLFYCLRNSCKFHASVTLLTTTILCSNIDFFFFFFFFFFSRAVYLDTTPLRCRSNHLRTLLWKKRNEKHKERERERLKLYFDKNWNWYFLPTDRQVFEREQTDGAVQVAKLDRGTDKNVVSKSSHQMEEAAYLEVKNRPEARTFPADLLSTCTVSPVTLLHSATRLWNTNVGWYERDDDDDTAATGIVVRYFIKGYIYICTITRVVAEWRSIGLSYISYMISRKSGKWEELYYTRWEKQKLVRLKVIISFFDTILS